MPSAPISTVGMLFITADSPALVDAASHAYFHKSPAQLTSREAALLAATLPNPHIYHANRPSSYVLRRAAWIEQQMRQLGGPAYLPK